MGDGKLSRGKLGGRIALITGASRGIGAAVARLFAAEGAQVVLVSRSVGGLEEVDDAIRAAGHPGATLLPLDLADGAKIDQLGYALAERFGRLDALVLNAGMLGGFSPVGHQTPKIFEKLMAVNFAAPWRLIRACDPLLRASPAGRIIATVGGPGTSTPEHFTGPYAASKAALLSLMQTYAVENAKTKLRVNCVDPGTVATRLRAEGFPGEDASGFTTPEGIAPLYLDLATAECERNGVVLRLQ